MTGWEKSPIVPLITMARLGWSQIDLFALVEKMITKDILKSLLEYDSDTGVFVWKNSAYHRVRGKVAGSDNGKGYMIIRINGVGYKAHRLAWLYENDKLPDSEIDHINGQKSDNRICNLRLVDTLENRRNRTRQSNNTSGFNGVYLDKRRNRWCAHIKIKNKRIYIGSFVQKRDAISARINANKEYGFHENHGREK